MMLGLRSELCISFIHTGTIDNAFGFVSRALLVKLFESLTDLFSMVTSLYISHVGTGLFFQGKCSS